MPRSQFHPDMFKGQGFNSEEWTEKNKALREQIGCTKEFVAEESKTIREEMYTQFDQIKKTIKPEIEHIFRLANNPNPMSKVTMDSLAQTLEERKAQSQNTWEKPVDITIPDGEPPVEHPHNVSIPERHEHKYVGSNALEDFATTQEEILKGDGRGYIMRLKKLFQ